MTLPETIEGRSSPAASRRMAELRRLRVLGVPVVDATMQETLALVEDLIERPDSHARSICFVNAHTLNVVSRDAEAREALRAADWVFGDGTGVRWAVRHLHGVRLRDNVNGTDFVPLLLSSFAGRGYRYYLLGGRPEMVAAAAEGARRRFPEWQLAGHHHGYVGGSLSERVIDDINDKRPDVLLVGMGNPTQEKWIRAHRDRLCVPLCIGVGGLMAYWSGDLTRAPAWLRRCGFEWIHLMLRQPRKLGRYLFGNPHFLLRVAAARIRRTDVRGGV